MRLIDADALIEAILEARRSKTDTVPKLIALINNQPIEAWKGLTPTADVMEVLQDLARNGSQSRFCKYEPKRGRWKVKRSRKWSGGGGTFCSNCNSGYSFGAFLDVEDFNYCPNCGAKMEASDD